VRSILGYPIVPPTSRAGEIEFWGRERDRERDRAGGERGGREGGGVKGREGGRGTPPNK
jgi:hypothetical protein